MLDLDELRWQLEKHGALPPPVVHALIAELRESRAERDRLETRLSEADGILASQVSWAREQMHVASRTIEMIQAYEKQG